jgi:hypothetical protein
MTGFQACEPAPWISPGTVWILSEPSYKIDDNFESIEATR